VANGIVTFLNVILAWFSDRWQLPADHWVGVFLAAAIQCGVLNTFVAVSALVYIWMERKVSGRIQDRLGPTRVGGKFGWLQTLADGVKLLTKEDLMPGNADGLLFKLAPYISFTASFSALIAFPFAAGWVAHHVNVAAFFVLAILGLEVFGVILAGYGSGSKWSLFGGMREAAQVVSYEVPLGMCVLIPVMICGTMDLVAIGQMQAGFANKWLIFHDPATFLVFWVYFTCAMASVNRAPFDLAEAESELVAGFHTEYSGLRWSLFFMAEYGSMFVVSALGAILFFGGWNGPVPIFHLIGWAYPQEATEFALTGYLANLAGCLNLIFKGVVGVTVMMWVRWTLPRLRIDQVITMCWKYCVPLAAICFVGVLGWDYLGLPSPNDYGYGPAQVSVREGWAVAAAGAPQSDAAESASGASDSEADGAEAGEAGAEVGGADVESASVGGRAGGALQQVVGVGGVR
jgi:NADH-quinone oxidoreductase subunit H